MSVSCFKGGGRTLARKVAERVRAMAVGPAPMRKPSDWAWEEFGFEADPRQKEVLDTPARRVLLCCSRQWGKSTVTALRALHFARHHPGSTTLCVTPSQRQSGLFLEKVQRYLQGPVARDTRDAASVKLPNGSSIIGLPAQEATIRGFDNVGFLILDEAAMIDDNVYTATRPMRVLSDGLLWMISTPHGQSGFFHDAWHDGDAGWARFRVPAGECARFSPDVLAQERIALGERMYAQEYLCEFLPSDQQMIPAHLVDSAVTSAEEPLDETPFAELEGQRAA
ncbi:MAG: hypothetical protein QM757_46985 [Paludibaculum sp.]